MEQKAGQNVKPAVFITGAGRGLGLCLCRLFLKSGWTVFAGKHHTGSGLAALAGPDFHPIPLDVTGEQSVETAARTTGSLTGAIDVLINNAAVCENEGGRIEHVDFNRVTEIMNVNALGPLRVTKAFLPLLRAGTLKTIVNISSEAGSIEDCWRKGMFGYCMSKAALNMQSRLLDNYLKDSGFRILAIHPGWMRTDMGGMNADIAPEEAAQGIFGMVTGTIASNSGRFLDYNGKRLRF
ncbi:MAG: SDR family oxidoreductase [Chitinispirillaceae bacterium]|nr:SDR family oxidoreductase [Chitinispirillaceae bacterium]